MITEKRGNLDEPSVAAGKRFELEVCFADGAAPACATFVLLVHPGLGMQQVQVLRQPRAVGYYQQLAEMAQAEVQECRAEVRQLRAERGVPEGLRGAVASGLVNLGRGVDGKYLSDTTTEKEGNALGKKQVYSYRAEGRVAVEVWLLNPGTEPWTAAGAVLRGPKGEVLKPLPLWQPGPILPPVPERRASKGASWWRCWPRRRRPEARTPSPCGTRSASAPSPSAT